MTLELTILENNSEEKNKKIDNTDNIDKIDIKNENPINKYNPCVYSSFLFLILSVIAKYYNYRELAISLLILFITSIIFHSNINTYTRVIDKIAILITVYFTSIIYYNKCCSRKYMLKVCDIQKNYTIDKLYISKNLLF